MESIVGQAKVAVLLGRALRSGRIGHAFLFFGPSGVGKFAMAREFARCLLCPNARQGVVEACEDCPSCRQVEQLEHPDLLVVLPSPKEQEPEAERALLDRLAADPYRVEHVLVHPTISIERIREVQRFASLAAAPGQRRVVLIPLAERMTAEAANSLLKLLEEPPEGMVFILTTPDPSLLPPTIVSRCHLLRLAPVPQEELQQALVERHGLEMERARLLATLAAGSYADALAWIEEDAWLLRERGVELLRTSLRGLPEQVKFALEMAPRSDRETRHRLLALLNVLQLWLRDAFLSGELGEKAMDLVANRDDLEVIERFNKNLSLIDYEALFNALDAAAYQVRRNVALRLVLLVLMGRFRQSIRR
ncbi:MAG: DNA polymerase III subunit delta' [candidate division KSB1 bacterium]|nr:DNA polymerase III subunit delta' [candidate division KSB1 bacterium]